MWIITQLHNFNRNQLLILISYVANIQDSMHISVLPLLPPCVNLLYRVNVSIDKIESFTHELNPMLAFSLRVIAARLA
jgi:hypothetical protein